MSANAIVKLPRELKTVVRLLGKGRYRLNRSKHFCEDKEDAPWGSTTWGFSGKHRRECPHHKGAPIINKDTCARARAHRVRS